jgi:hypothetical protein
MFHAETGMYRLIAGESKSARRHMLFRGMLACAILVVGCTSQEKSPDQVNPALRTPVQNPKPDVPVVGEACLDRLHEISGALLAYYALHKELPQRLEDLSELKDMGIPVPPLTCPVSGKSYAYYPRGLIMPGNDGGRIIVHDEMPVHGGLRFGIRMFPPGAGDHPGVDAIPLPDSIFLLLRKG